MGYGTGKASHGWNRGKGDEAGRVKRDQSCLIAFIQGLAWTGDSPVSDQPCTWSVNGLYLCCPEALSLLTSIIQMVHIPLEHPYSQLPHGSECLLALVCVPCYEPIDPHFFPLYARLLHPTAIIKAKSALWLINPIVKMPAIAVVCLEKRYFYLD